MCIFRRVAFADNAVIIRKDLLLPSPGDERGQSDFNFIGLDCAATVEVVADFDCYLSKVRSRAAVGHRAQICSIE